jgi:hypothetical protein
LKGIERETLQEELENFLGNEIIEQLKGMEGDII